MAKGPKGFSEEEKAELRTRLCQECETSWGIHGYKKTSIGELTQKVGIAAGTFYLLYPAKEDLFHDVLIRVQGRLKKGVWDIVENEKGKSGIEKALVWHYLEYDRTPFLYNTSTPDFIAFLNKLSKEDKEKLVFDSETFFSEVIKEAGLVMKLGEKKVFDVITTLISIVMLRERAGTEDVDYFGVFQFLLRNALDEIFE